MPEPQIPILRWLHLSDLHIGRNNESQKTALASLTAAINQFAAGRAFDLVLLTGDLAFSGRRDEYGSLQNQLIQPLRSNPLFNHARFIGTPGNHDLNCEIELPPTWERLGRTRQDKFFHFGEEGRLTRGSRPKAFAEYGNYTKGNAIESVSPIDEPALLITVDRLGRSIAFISVVTGFFSDKDVSDHNKTPAPVHPLRTLIQQLPESTQIVILGHHPLEWFTQESEKHLYSLLVEKNALYLHGHEHRIRAKFGARGLVSLGFGAVYQAPFESAPASYYRNSFAICELTDSLHISVVTWDSEHGQWRPEQHLPGDFIQRSEQLPDGYVLPIPTTRLGYVQPYASLATAIRSEIRIDRCMWLVENEPQRWAELFCTIGVLRDVSEIYKLPNQTLPAGHSQFRVKEREGQYLIYAVSGYGDILHHEQLQAINTELDRQDYDGCIVATLGEFSTEAKTLATQLAVRKPIAIFERMQIVHRAIRNLPIGLERAIINGADLNLVSGCLVITQGGYALLLVEKTKSAWFQLLDENGLVIPESSELVMHVRQEQPSLARIRYASIDENSSPASISLPVVGFDRKQYLTKSYDYFDNVKYAPLAALGFRFRKASLSGIYVQASADVGNTSKNTLLTRAVSEFVESLNLPKAQQYQLESQLRSQYGLTRTSEVGAARKLYQRYNNVVVLGDPGSGKTCFVQHEILAYCAPPADQGSWYSNHLPIYIPLAEAARLFNDSTSLLDVCEIVSSRRGIDLPRNVIEESLADGRAAFFFDGLDEVGYIDKRITLITQINELVKVFAPRGNRFVIASRPAATQPVEIPEAFTFLQLKGLTEQEIRTLASRVLTARIGGDDDSALSADEAELIDRLLLDTRSKPDIARIARNPLLLTLLVLIYANTGALSARRHLIYTQAIKTLVSVRGRQTREQQISEADLRIRLGALALGIFQRQVAEIPKRSEVVDLFEPLMLWSKSVGDTRSSAVVADAFLQEVAESTGLLVIHAKEDEEHDDIITFMHYSFLEYYAAAGLLSRSYLDIVPELTGNPRWREVITLLFGMLSEQGDVTPLFEQILFDDSVPETISRYKAILALDCATECDVPPERSQDLLATMIYETVGNGAGRYSPGLRGQIARRLGHFLQTAGAKIKNALSRGLRSSDAIAAAAFADLIARVGEDVVLPEELISAFGDCLDHENPVTRAAALHAIERIPELRTPKARSVIKKALKGTVIEKHAALKVVAVVQVGESLRDEIRDLLDDSNSLISAAAAQCLIMETLKEGGKDHSLPPIEKVLLKLHQQTSQETGLSLQGITLDRDTIRSLVFSADTNESELAVRYVPLIRDDDQFVYETLIQRLRTTGGPATKAACLDSLRAVPGAISLITIADTDMICSQLKATNRNVRIAAVKLMAEMPSDEQVVQNLQEQLNESANTHEDEIEEVAKAIAKHVKRNQRLRVQALRSVLEKLPKRADQGFGDAGKQRHISALLSVCESIGGVIDEKAAWRLYEIAEDFRTPMRIRRQAWRVFGRLVEPSTRSVTTFIESLRRDDVRLNDEVYAATASFVSQCRRKVEYVRRVFGKLEDLRVALSEAWKREAGRSPESINPPGLTDIRDSLVEVSNLMISFEEFSGRAQVS